MFGSGLSKDALTKRQRFLDGLADEMDRNASQAGDVNAFEYPKTCNNLEGPSIAPSEKLETSVKGHIACKNQPSSNVRHRALVHDAVVNVVISSRYMGVESMFLGISCTPPGAECQIKAKMIISIWTLENQRFFTLTFTTDYIPSSTRRVSRPTSNSHPTSPTSPSFITSYSSSPSSVVHSATGVPLSVSPFPPLGAPSKSDIASYPSVLQKIARMKDGMINAMEIPVFVMWKDESLVIPNTAATRLMHHEAKIDSTDALDLISRFKVYTEDFERELLPEELPLVKLCRTQKPFSRIKIGIINSRSERKHFDASGEGIIDEKTGEFLAGIVTLNDVTEYTDIIKSQSEENDQQFQLICDTMPQLLWTTTDQGISTF